MERTQIPEDGAIHQSYLLGEILAYELGPAFMEALVGVVLRAAGAERLRMGQLTSQDLWLLTCATTAQRTEAAEAVLKHHSRDREQG